MAMNENRSWKLESFLDSLIVELDQAQDILALKGINRPLTYTVKDIGLDLQIFPVYTDDGILFSTARPGESGASRVNIQFGSITDRQIRETTKAPIGKDDISVELVEDIDEDTRKTLKKIGVKSVRDFERMEEKNVDLGKVGAKKVDYRKLANVIAQAKRKGAKPAVKGFRLEKGSKGFVLSLSGSNLSIDDEDTDFPIALINRKNARVLSAGPDEIHLALSGDELAPGSNEVVIALDRHSIIRVDLKTENPEEAER